MTGRQEYDRTKDRQRTLAKYMIDKYLSFLLYRFIHAFPSVYIFANYYHLAVALFFPWLYYLHPLHALYRKFKTYIPRNETALFPSSTFMYLGAIYTFPLWDLFRISIFLYYMRDLSAQLQEQREGQGTAAKQGLAAQSPVIPTAPAVESRVHINNQNKQTSNLENYGS
jgi:hypothetical protein